MNYFTLFIALLFMVCGVISVPHNRFNGPDPDSHNRLSRVNQIRMYYDDNHANQMNPNNDEYWHSRE
tara:strand:+ start:204 stop:404 length:201 start_codon:yes stop_codon:yes gene_type:complete